MADLITCLECGERWYSRCAYHPNLQLGTERRPPVELRAPGVPTLTVDMLQAHVSDLRRQMDELRMVVNSMLAEQRESRKEPHPHG